MTAAERGVTHEVLELLAGWYDGSTSASQRNAIILIADKLVVDGGPRLVLERGQARVVEPEVDRG